MGSQNLKITENYRLNNDEQIEDSSRSIERVEPAEISNAATEESSTSSNQATQSTQTRWTRPLTNESLVSRDFISERRSSLESQKTKPLIILWLELPISLLTLLLKPLLINSEIHNTIHCLFMVPRDLEKHIYSTQLPIVC